MPDEHMQNSNQGGDSSFERMINELREETNFAKYIDRLANFKHKLIIIAANDTPCGSTSFTPYVASKLMSLGFNISLHNKFHQSYIGIVNNSNLLFENISRNQTVKYDCEINGLSIYVESAGYFVTDGIRTCKIEIGGKDYAICKRGLAFVVYDLVSAELIDNVTFDTYLPMIICHRWGDSKRVRQFKQRHSGVTFISPTYPKFPKSNLSDNERFIAENALDFNTIKANAHTLPTVLNDYLETPKDIREVLSTPTAYIGTDGARKMKDLNGKHLNVVFGHRISVNQPDKSKRAIYVVGGCDILGIGARDCGTLASHLQIILNEHIPEQGFIVENYGCFLDGTDQEAEITKILESLPLKSGDIVIGYGGIPSADPGFSERPHNYGELFFDTGHHTEAAHRLVAEEIFKLMKENDYFEDSLNILSECRPQPQSVSSPEDYGFSVKQWSALKQYKQGLESFYDEYWGGAEPPPKIGAIVMNCNPFTLGHRYLIETSAKAVDYLFVFVVQEDRSFFPFEDRIALVDEGTADLLNVGVTGSGQFIISALTFKEYFNKSELQNMQVDTAMDITLFAKEIAPCLHIAVRFVGEEPFDKVTRQYNEMMKAVLPQYGIELVEIPRKEQGGEPISASRVRALLEEKNFDEIARIVPQTTLDYLMDKYAGKV